MEEQNEYLPVRPRERVERLERVESFSPRMGVRNLNAIPQAQERSDDLLHAGSSHHGYKKGIVGPVYTFVKTDPYAHVKWGVRHVAGKKYAHG